MGIPIRPSRVLWRMAVTATLAGGCFSAHDTDSPHDAGADDDAAVRCEDGDGDGWGEGPGCEGPDCDDGDGARHDDCPCDDGSTRECYGGAPVTEDVGLCHGGRSTCNDGSWGPCVGEIGPIDEVCDGADQDCDGEVDEGAMSSCGDCDLTCHMFCAGVDCPAPLVAGEGAAATGDGGIHIADSATDLARHVLWMGDDARGVVRLVDTRTFEVLGVYRDGNPGGNVRPVTVDPRGNAIVVVPPYVMRVDASDCTDANRDGVITTSSGADDLLDWGEDDCVRWHSEIGSSIFAAAFARDGRVWIGGRGNGFPNDPTVTEIDPDTGEYGEIVALETVPDALLGDHDGLWVGSSSSLERVELPSLDTMIVEGDGLGSDRLDLDGAGRVLLSGSGRLIWFDPNTSESSVVDEDALFSTVDRFGQTWTMGPREGGIDNVEVRRWNDDLTRVETFPLRVEGRRLAADLDGQVWTSRRNGDGLEVYDAVTGEHRATLGEECGEYCQIGSWSWLGDPAGVRLHRALPELIERAETVVPFDIECDQGETGTVHVVTVETDAAASPVVDVRGAVGPDALEQQPWVLLARGDDTRVPMRLHPGTLPPGASTLQVRVRLRGDGGVVSRVRLQWRCTPGGA